MSAYTTFAAIRAKRSIGQSGLIVLKNSEFQMPLFFGKNP
jgi:hypothetical protein